MSEEQNVKHWVINEQQLGALQEFIGSLALPWKQTNPYMQLLCGLRPVNYQAPASDTAPTVSALVEQASPPMQDSKKNSRRKATAK